MTSAGWGVLAEQEDDPAYNTLAIDGSTVTNFTADYVDDEVDVSVAANFSLEDLYAWWVYNLTTSQGISDFFGGIEAVDSGNFNIKNNVVDISLDNTTSTEVFATDNRRIYRDDGARPIRNPTSGGGGIDVEWRNPVLIAETGVSGLTPAESAQLASITDVEDDLVIINNGVKKASLLIPHTQDL